MGHGHGGVEETSNGAAFEEVEQYLELLKVHFKVVANETKFLAIVSKDTSSHMCPGKQIVLS